MSVRSISPSIFYHFLQNVEVLKKQMAPMGSTIHILSKRVMEAGEEETDVSDDFGGLILEEPPEKLSSE